jgi:hypothetical protein
MEHPTLKSDTGAWVFQVWASFVVALSLMVVGIYNMSTDIWVKGYLIMGLFFTVGSCFNLAKTLRDQQESRRLINRFTDAKTEKILSEFELKR